ncbi:MAG: VanW family protein [Acidimicrobiales bacterium]
MPRPVRVSLRVLIPIATVATAVVVVLGVWLVDVALHRNDVARHVRLEDGDVSGFNHDSLAGVVEDLANRFAATPVEIRAGTVTFRSTEGSLGVRIDRAATMKAVFDARRGSAPLALPRWIASLFGTVHVEARLLVDKDTISKAVAALVPAGGGEPVEPTLEVRDATVVVVGGKPGTGVDAGDVQNALLDNGFEVGLVEITVPPKDRRPTTSLADAQKVADEANRLTELPLEVSVGSATTTLTSEQIRHWLVPATTGGRLGYSFDNELMVNDLASLLAAGTTRPSDASVTLGPDNVPVVSPSVDGQTCCTSEAADVVVNALRERPTTGAVALPTKVIPPAVSTADVNALGIKEEVSTFTTKHPCCAPRVQNIHKLADMVRGVVMRPGDTFSFNKFIGERTVDKGWVEAPTILDGKLAPSPGGGISQFMTTMFNAAWFAGLDFAEYQSHSIYISRYPFGREATISWPSPDLKVTNSTPYGLMIWPTYTETTITITIYSTNYFTSVTQGDQSSQFSGKSCSSITTPRIRTYLDGTVKTDLFYARYQAREGLLCSDPLPAGVSPIPVPGQPPPSVPPSATTPTTAATTTVAPAPPP